MSLPVITVAQMREWEKATWASGQTETEVIHRVGEVVSKHALRLTQPGDLILILAGKGHNGEDAQAARPHLTERRVEVLSVTNPQTDLARLRSVLSLSPALVIDGLFGIGLNRPLSPDWVRFIETINEAKRPVLAVDVPSGFDAEAGDAKGAAVRARVTLTVGAPKGGMLKSSAWEYVGRLEIAADVGLIECPAQSFLLWTDAEDFAQFPPPREVAGHKGTYGHVALVCGSRGYHGAAVLASRGAQRAQPGLITLHTTEAAYIPVASQCQAVMVSPTAECLDLEHNYTALLFGPGLAGLDVPCSWREKLKQLWSESPLPIIVDASALAWLPQGATPPNSIRVLTPHPGEAARLLKTNSKEIQNDRVSSLKKLSTAYGNALVLLKGHQSIVGSATSSLFVNSSGNAYMAQGGSGDLLSGFITGLLAQPPLQKDPLYTLRYSVWEHGAAADRLQQRKRNWVIEDLANELGQGSGQTGARE